MSESLKLSECEDLRGIQDMVIRNSKSCVEKENVRNLWLYNV